MSTINRGPLGSASLINRESSNGNGSGTATASSSAFSTEPQASTSPKSSSTIPSSSSSEAIPMPGPTLATPPSSSLSDYSSPEPIDFAKPGAVPVPPPRGSLITTDLVRSLAEVKGQAQFLLYLADQIEDSLHQLVEEHDDCQNAFLCRILSMYSAQLETKHHGLGDKISETCQEVYVTVREYDAT